MPVEIKELIIRAVVDRPLASSAGTSPAAPASDSSAALIEACVRQVVKILDKSRER
jgi:hypothetical protein